MLQKIIIKNYAIIDNLEIAPDAHLNTVTGETGAGKSIILGALSLILGERADISVLINKQEKCVVEAHFDVKDNRAFNDALQQEDIDHEPVCIIRREIGVSGKSRAFINDTPVNLNVLNKLTSLLVDLHQQFDHLSLEDDHFQMDVVDAIGQTVALRQAYFQLYTAYKKITGRLEENRQKQAQWQKESDYKQFLLDELLQAAYTDDEIENVGQQLKQMNSSERIVSVLQAGRVAIDEGEQPMANELKRLSQQLQSIADVFPDVAPLQQRLNSAYAELKDIAAELEQMEGKVSLDPELMVTLQERIDTGYKLFKKHGVNDTAGLLAVQRQLEEELKATLDLNATIDKLAKEQEAAYDKMIAEGERLSAKRMQAAPQLSEKVTELLALVGMPNARFNITLDSGKPGPVGLDNIQFLLDANKNGKYQPVEKAASGGEMSRIMLSIKSLTAKAMQLPTLIFDEVDTGISEKRHGR